MKTKSNYIILGLLMILTFSLKVRIVDNDPIDPFPSNPGCDDIV